MRNLCIQSRMSGQTARANDPEIFRNTDRTAPTISWQSSKITILKEKDHAREHDTHADSSSTLVTLVPSVILFLLPSRICPSMYGPSPSSLLPSPPTSFPLRQTSSTRRPSSVCYGSTSHRDHRPQHLRSNESKALSISSTLNRRSEDVVIGTHDVVHTSSDKQDHHRQHATLTSARVSSFSSPAPLSLLLSLTRHSLTHHRNRVTTSVTTNWLILNCPKHAHDDSVTNETQHDSLRNLYWWICANASPDCRVAQWNDFRVFVPTALVGFCLESFLRTSC